MRSIASAFVTKPKPTLRIREADRTHVRRLLLTRRPRLLHVEVALKLIEHLVEAFLYRFGLDRAKDPAHVVLLLRHGSATVGFDQTRAIRERS